MKKLIAASLVALCFSGNVFAEQFALEPAYQNNKVSDLRLFLEVRHHFQTNFYKEVDEKEWIEKIFKQGISGYDHHSRYLTEIEAKRQKEGYSEDFAGIGAMMGQKTVKKENLIVIMSVIKGGSAAEANLKSGDWLVAISSDGKKENAVWVENLSIDEAVNLIRGEEGTKVYLLINQNNKLSDFILERRHIELENLTGKMIAQKIGYVKINAFNDEKFVQAFQVLVSSLEARGANVLILDLRDNPGGYLQSAVSISNFFRKDRPNIFYNTPIVYTKFRNKEEQEKGNISEAGKFSKFKVIILTNDGTASASEIVTAYLKNYCGAKVIGETTFGKGVGQSILKLSSGGTLNLTTFEYLVGKDMVKVHGIGIVPDIKIENPEKVETEADDLQLQRALQEAQKLIEKQ